MSVALADVGDGGEGRQDDQHQRQEEAKGEEEDVVRDVLLSGPGRGATHTITL